MGARSELEDRIHAAARPMELVEVLPSNPSWFQLKLVEVVNEVVDMDIVNMSQSREAVLKDTVERFLPLVDFLTCPRSMGEFQDLRRGLLEVMWEYNYRRESKNEEGARASQVVWWLHFLLPEVKVFSQAVVDALLCSQLSPGEIWEEFWGDRSIPARRPEDKILTREQVVRRTGDLRSDERGLFGYAAGKYRADSPHSEHIGYLAAAREVLGSEGLLIVGVESRNSVHRRRGEDHYVESDHERLTRIAALEAVDAVFLLDPSDEEVGDLPGYYDRLWEALAPDFYFFGSADYHWRSIFEERGRQLGTILLWERPTDTISTSELIRRIRAAG